MFREQVDDTHERVHYGDTYNTDYWPAEDYPRCKKDLAENYPAFKVKWLKQLNENMHYANPSIPVPPAGPNEDVSVYVPARWEQQAFGPVNLAIGRKYPFHDRPGVGHFDADTLPISYMQKFPLRRRTKSFL